MSKTTTSVRNFINDPENFKSIKLNIDYEDCLKLAKVLKYNDTVKSMDFRKSEIGDRSIAVLAKVFEYNNTIESQGFCTKFRSYRISLNIWGFFSCTTDF